MSNPATTFVSRARTTIVDRLRARGWLTYPAHSESLVAFQGAMAWVRDHLIHGEGVAADDSMTSVDVRATSEIVECLKYWGEREEVARLSTWLAAREARGGGILPEVTIEPDNEPVRAAKRAQREGRGSEALQLLQSVSAGTLRRGGLPAGAGRRRFCPLTTATAAGQWFEVGNWTEGEPLFQTVLAHLAQGGGFEAVVESGAPRVQYAACVAAYLNALHFRLLSGFERTAPMFPETIPPEDGRFVLVERVLIESGASRVIDAGCGKGRFIKLLKQRHPQIDARAVDISTSMLKMLPPDIRVQAGSLLDLALPDGTGDFVFCIEALEHAVNARAALRELARVTSPAGYLLIIDKCASRLGSMEICDWEQWFDADEVKSWLVEEGFQVDVQRGVFKPGEKDLDDRFLCWIARRS